MRIYHDTDDKLVPYEMAKNTYDSLIANGADTSMVKIITMPGGHDYFPAYKLMIEWFETFE